MNSLSWFIYAIGVLDTMRGAASLVLLLAIFLGIAGIVFAPFIADAVADPQWGPFFKGKINLLVIVICCAGLVNVFAPSRQTMLLIAGSEIGQRVVESKSVTEIVDPSVDLLKSWIREETKKLNKEKS